MTTPRTSEPRPTVSGIIATRSRPELVRAAIRSMLAQEPHPPDEIIVVFDQAEPDPKLVDEFAGVSVRVLTNTRTPGLPGARNTAIEAATGDWIAICDDDDEWAPDRLASQLARANGAAFVVGGITIKYGDRRWVRSPGTESITFEMLLKSRVMAAHSSTFLIRTSAVHGSLGWVDEEVPGLGYGEDYDWLLRAARLGPIPAVNRPVAMVTWNPDSFYRNRWQSMIDGTQALLDKTPEFRTTRAGLARMKGHMAFAHAGSGHKREAARLAWETFRLDPRQLRTYLTLAVLAGVIKAEWLVRTLNSFGRGV